MLAYFLYTTPLWKDPLYFFYLDFIIHQPFIVKFHIFFIWIFIFPLFNFKFPCLKMDIFLSLIYSNRSSFLFRFIASFYLGYAFIYHISIIDRSFSSSYFFHQHLLFYLEMFITLMTIYISSNPIFHILLDISILQVGHS